MARQHKLQPKDGAVWRGMNLSDGTDPNRATIALMATATAKAAAAKIETEASDSDGDEEVQVTTTHAQQSSDHVGGRPAGSGHTNVVATNGDASTPTAIQSGRGTRVESDAEGELQEDEIASYYITRENATTKATGGGHEGGKLGVGNESSDGEDGGETGEDGSTEEEDTEESSGKEQS